MRLSGADLDGPEPRVNDQNSMGRPAVIGNENRFVHDPAREGWPWRGEALAVHLGRLLSTLLGLVALIALGSIFGRVFRAASTPSDALLPVACRRRPRPGRAEPAVHPPRPRPCRTTTR
ncbi:MAG: hypothetical protein U0470_07555 [Anaerolineae bacterium]